MADETQDTATDTQAPVKPTSPAPAKTALYQKMVDDKMYSKSFDEFQKQFSTPEKVAKLHDFLTSKGVYDKGQDNFQKQFFSDVPPAPKAAPAPQQSVAPTDNKKKNSDQSAPSQPASASGSQTSGTQFEPSHQLNLNPPGLIDAQVHAAQANNELQVAQQKQAGKSPIGSLIQDYSKGQPADMKNTTAASLSTPAILQTNSNQVTKDQYENAAKAGITMENIPDASKVTDAYYQAHPGDKNILPTPQGEIKTATDKTISDKVRDVVIPFDAGVIKGVGDLKKTAADLEGYTDKLLVKAGLMDSGTAANFKDNSDASMADFDKKSNLGYNEEYLNSNPIVGIGKMVPMLMGGESNGAKIASLQAWGSAAESIDKMKSAGIKFDNGSDVLYKGGSALINYFLMKDVFGSTLLNGAGQETFNGVVGTAAADATKALADEGIDATAQSYANAYYLKALSIGAKVQEMGMGAIKTYAKVGADFAGAGIADVELKKLSNALNSNNAFKDVKGEDLVKAASGAFYNGDTPANGSLTQFVKNLIETPAAAFSALHLAQSSGMLFKNSPYVNPVIADLQKDNSPEAVQSLKDQLAKYGKDNQWSDQDIQATHAKIDELADLTTKIPKDIAPAKFNQAINLVMERRHMEGILDGIKAKSADLDPALAGKASAFQRSVEAMVDQSNDRLAYLVTDKPWTYFEHQGEYFKVQQDEKPIQITKDRYELEGVNNVRGSLADGSKVMEEGTADKKGNPIPEPQVKPVKAAAPAKKEEPAPEPVKPVEKAEPKKEVEPVVKEKLTTEPNKENAKPESPEAVTSKSDDHGKGEKTEETEKDDEIKSPDLAETGDGVQSPVFSNPDEADRHWITHETDPEAIASYYHQQNFTPENTADYKENLIHQYLGNSKINANDFQRYGDNNLLAGNPALGRRIDKTNSGIPLDTQAQEASKDNFEITPQDLVDHIVKYNTANEFKEKAKTQIQKDLADKYQELTGNTLTDKRSEDSFNKQQGVFKASKLSDEARDIIEAEGITPANIDKLRGQFTGFPYTPEDFDNVKRYLDEQASQQKPNKSASGAAPAQPGTKSPGVVAKQPEAADPIRSGKSHIASDKELVAKRNANPDGGEGVKKVKSALNDKDKKAVDDIRKRIRERLNGPDTITDMSYTEDEEDELLNDGIKLTRLYFKAGIRAFPDFAGIMIEDMGESIVPYLKSFYEVAKNLPGNNVQEFDGTDVVDYHIAKLNEDVDPEQLFVDRVKNEINSGNKLNITGIEGIASEAGLSADTRVNLQDFVERALIELGRDIVDNPLLEDKEKFDELVKLYNNQPSLNQRSSTKVMLQQYSTPMPYAYSAGLFVDNISPKRVYDPTAGTGMMLIAFDPGKTVTNELDPKRVKILQQLGYSPTAFDAADDVPINFVDGVMANPPFGPGKNVSKFNDFKFSKLDYVIPLKALTNMKNTGRAAIIIGGHSTYDKHGMLIGDDLRFFHYLHHYYNVADVINVDGGLYAKQGTTFPTRLILINGRKEVPQDYAPGYDEETNKPVKTFEDLYNRVQERINQNEKPSVLQSRVDVQPPAGNTDDLSGTGEVPAKEPGRPATVSGTKDNEPGRGSNAGEGTGKANIGGQPESTGELQFPTGDSEGDNGNGQLAKVPDAIAKFAEGAENGVIGPERTGEFVPADRSLSANRATADQLVKNEKVPYVPASGLTEAGSVIPANMAYETEQNLKDLQDLYGPIDTWVANELGYHDLDDLNNAFFAEQVDALGLAIHQLKQGKGMIIGDMTGIGKGRIAAGLIRWVAQQGEIPTFFTENADLFSDIYRDLHGIGSGHLTPFIINDPSSDRDANVKRGGQVIYKAGTIKDKRQFFETKKVPRGTKVILSTYSQINSEKQSLKRDFIAALTKGGYMFLDESHNVAGDSNSGKFFQGLLGDAKGAAFFSATYAKRADNMPVYALKTSISDANMSNEALVEAIQSGGNALQEIVASQLVKAGQMVRRERDFTGVENEFITLGVDKDGNPDELGKQHRELADQVIDVCNSIIDFEKTHVVPAMQDLQQKLVKAGKKLTQTKSKSLSVSNTPFASKMFNIVNQMLFSIKAPQLAHDAIKELRENNRKPLIRFNSTMESFIKNGGYKAGDEITDTSFSASLMNGLKNTLKYRVEYPNGEKEVNFFDIGELGEEANIAWKQVTDMIKAASADMSISPIDTMIEILENAGLKVGEITGRGLKLKFNEDHTSATVESIGKRDIAGIIHDFNNGNGGGLADVILFNAAGATGFSMHADKSFRDQRQRVMINGQFDLDINKVIQGMGRIDRTNQVKRGAFKTVNTTIPAETRLAMMVSDKLKKLQANTAGDQKSKANEMKVVDFLNEYGDRVVTDYLMAHPDIYARLFHGSDPAGIIGMKPGSKPQITEGIARQTTGMAALLKVAEQDVFYNELSGNYLDYIDYLNNTDQNNLAVKSVDLNAKTLSSGVYIEGKHTQSPFGQDSMVEKVEVNVLRKPLSKDELEEAIDKSLDGKTPYAASIDLQNKVKAYYDDKLDLASRRIEKQYNERTEKNKKKFGKEPELLKYAEKQNDKEFEDALEQVQSDMAGAVGKMVSIFRDFQVGKELMVPSSISGADTKYTKGIFLGFSFKEKHAYNPYTPSNVSMKFAVLDGKRTIQVSVSQADFINALYAGDTIHAGDPQTRDLRKNWADIVKNTKAREVRHIVTGNILQAYRPNAGQLISYTTDRGTVAKGMLLPKGFDPATEGKNAGAVSMYERIMSLKPDGPGLVSADGKFIITKTSGLNTYFRIQVPKTTKEGGRYFKNAPLLDLVRYGEFETRGDKMEAYVPSYSLMDLLKTLEKEFGMKFNTGIDMEHVAHESDSEKQEYPKPSEKPSEPSGNIGNEQNFIKGKSTERIQADTRLPGRDMKKLPDVIGSLAEGLNVKMYYAKSRRANAAGSYVPSAGGIKLSTVGNLDVAIHEAGHALDDAYQLFDTIPAGDASAAMDELQWFADRGGSNPPPSLTKANKIEYLKREGIAEFVRAYAINKPQAFARAPKFFAHFEASVPDDVKSVIDEFGEDYLRYINGTPLDKIMANIEETPKEERSAYRKFINSVFGDKEGKFKLTPFDKIQIRLTNSGKAFDKSYHYILNLAGGSPDSILPENDAKMQSLLFAGVDGKIGSFFDNGIVNGKNEPIIDGRTSSRMNMEWLLNAFDTTSEETLNKDIALTMAYMFSERTIEKAMQFDRPHDISGISAAGNESDTDVAMNFLIQQFGQSLSREQKKRVVEGVRRYRLWSDKMMRYSVDKGRMSEQTYRDIKDKNVAYVAFLPVQENAPGIENIFDSVDALTRSANMGSVKTVIKEMTGSSQHKRNPYISLMQNTAAIIKEVDRNEILQSYVEPMINTIRSMGEGRVNPFANVMMEVGPAEKVQGKPVISVYINGDAKFYMFSDDARDVYHFINGLTKLPQLPGLVTAIPRMLKWTATMSPVFAKNHLIRSTFNRLVISRTGSGLGSFIKSGPEGEKELYALFGGSQNGYWLGNRVDYYKLNNQIIKDLASRGRALIMDPVAMGKKRWKAYEDLLHQSDLVNRMAEFRNAFAYATRPKSQGGLGMDDYNAGLYASFQAKDLLNAAVAGTWMKAINQLIPFSNVEVQGIKRNIKAATEGNYKGLGLWALRVGLYTVLPALLMRILAKNGNYEEEYDNLPAYQRDLGYNFKLPGLESWVYIPKPYDVGLISSGIDRAISSQGQFGENAWYGYDKTIYQDLLLMKPEMAVGPFAAVVEPMTNYSFFKQGPIVPRYEMDKVLSLRHNFESASRLGKGISNALSPLYKQGDGIDPRYIDNAMQSMFSYYGDWAMSLSDIGSKDSRHKFGLKTIGFVKDQQISGDVRPEKVYNLAKELGLENTRPVKDLSELIRHYYDETSSDKRVIIHKQIMDLAKNVYDAWESHEIYKKKIEIRGKKINFD